MILLYLYKYYIFEINDFYCARITRFVDFIRIFKKVQSSHIKTNATLRIFRILLKNTEIKKHVLKNSTIPVEERVLQGKKKMVDWTLNMYRMFCA